MTSHYNPIKLKRVYDKKEKSDGIRLLADRLWPRGIKKSELQYDDWIKELSPSNSLRKQWHNSELSYKQFSKRYSDELESQQKEMECIVQLANKETITLISAVKELENSHLPILKDHILDKLEEISPEETRERSSPVCYDNFQ
ncbi:hypothetical protein Q7A_1658 [Methylophaga nitratireducenticrescens]|nr:hypothetical protein Q7A_1658 [Methylophaga nitratireducenticrescens]AUZ86023.1 hypothetical protein CDW43_07935 [Methylophaga nitratireducenticrescens]